MTRNILITLAAVAALTLGGMARATTLRIEVNGLVCAFCAQGVEKQMRAQPATADVVVSLEHRLVAVALKDGQDISDAVITKAITDAGYQVVAIRRTDETLDTIRAELKR